MKCATCHRVAYKKNLCRACIKECELWYAELPSTDKLNFFARVDRQAIDIARHRTNISEERATTFLWHYLHAIEVL